MLRSALVEFLSKSKDILKQPSESPEGIHFVLGNESCDLDSVVSALSMGLLLHSQGKAAVPILNIPAEEFPLHTEVTYLLRESGISPDVLTFRDDVDLAARHAVGSLRLTLVDHHALADRDRALADAVEAVVDHRPLDQDAVGRLPVRCDVDVRVVGSCASLVAERVLRSTPLVLDRQVASLVRGAILLDTACFSPQADRTTPLDVSVVEACERQCGIEESREATFRRIVSARSDVSSLSSLQILHKDMKVVRGLPMPGMPLLVRDFAKRPDAARALAEYCAKHAADAAVVIGMSFTGEPPGTLHRDVAVHGLREQPAKRIVEALQSEDSLQLSQLPCQVPGMTLFEQKNTKLSRKQILPIVQRVLASD